MDLKTYSIDWGGRELTVELGRYARQAHGACTVRYGDTVVMATAVMSENQRDIDYFPLMVDYEEKLYAAGKIKGSRFIKREGRPSDEAILSARQIDRSLRPLFDDRIRNDIQVVITVLSWDEENDANVPGMIAAAIALHTSEIPWAGPIGGVRVGAVGDELILNPNYEQRAEAILDIFVAGNDKDVIMVEAGAKEASNDVVLNSIDLARKSMKPVVELIEKIQKEVGVEKRNIEIDESTLSEEELTAKKGKEKALELAESFVNDNINEYLFDAPKASKGDRVKAFKALAAKTAEHLSGQGIDEDAAKYASSKVKKFVEANVTRAILDNDKRVDGRGMKEVRELLVEIDLLPRTHGSGHFMRGETEVLSVLTLAGPGAEQIIDTMEYDVKKRYMHHYNFPPFSVGEARPLRGPGRRDIGHGALAERALEAVIPSKADYPYTIRVVSEVFGSNGSSSMASTCGSSLALMAGGVPITKHVAGIAIGLASDDEGNWKVLTDIQDLEDGKGGMDFKICGTRDGVTAIQMDTKTLGLNADIVNEAFAQAKEARLNIIEQMEAVIPKPAEMSKHAPRVETVMINPDKIRDVVGPGGKVINGIIDETGVEIDIEQDGSVMISSNDAEGMAKAVQTIKDIVREVEAGEKFTGEVVRIEDFGAFVNLLPNKDGLVHVSEISWERVEHPKDVLKLGDKVEVLVKEIDNLGRVNLTMKGLKPRPDNVAQAPRKDRGPKPTHKKKGFFRKKD